MSADKQFVFDWHAERNEGGFLKWFLPTVMVGLSQTRVDELSERTHGFTDVQVQVLINGAEVNAEHFLQGVERNLEATARDEARRMLNEVGGLDALEERIAEIRNHLITQVENALSERGIELPSRED
jgi:hypothetical protein